MQLNSKKTKKKNKIYRFKQNFIEGCNYGSGPHYSVNSSTSFFSNVIVPSVFQFKAPSYNAKYSLRRRNYFDRLVWRMYGRPPNAKWSSDSLSTSLRLYKFSYSCNFIVRAFIKRIFRRRWWLLKRKHLVPLYVGGFSVISQIPRFLRKNLDQKINYWFFVQLNPIKFLRKKLNFLRRKRSLKSNLNLRRNRRLYSNRRFDKFTLLSRARFIDKPELNSNKTRPWCRS